MDDKEIKKLLGDIPPIKDNRSKEVILARLQEDERLQKAASISPKHKKSVKWIPVFVAIASLFILSLLLPSMLRGNHEQADNALNPASERIEQSLDMDGNEMESFSLDDSKADGILESSSNILLLEELGDVRTFQIGLVSNANVIPVTFLIPAERILADFQEEPNTVQLYNKYAAQIPEEVLGFDAYHPYEGEITVENDVIVHKLPDNHGYDQASASIDVYINSIKATFIDSSKFQTVDMQGEFAQFNQVGLMDPIDLSVENRFAAYYKYLMPSGQVFLVPQGKAGDYATVDQALLGMQKSENDIVKSVVPGQLKYNVDVKNGVATIRFSELLDLSEMEVEDVMAMIEGFILTADCYHHVVQFENLLQKNWGKYDFTLPFSKPFAVNPTELTLD